MPKRNNKNNRDRGRGSPNPRGNSQGRGRGRGRGRGGRGQSHNVNDSPSRLGGNYPHREIDYVVQVWQEPPSNFSRGGGRGGPSGSATSQRGGSTPRRGGRGFGRGRGRGELDRDAPTGRARPGFGFRNNNNNSARESIYSKPVIFVPSVHTRTLFEEVEDILQPVVESADVREESHVPTADRVTRVFSGRDLPPPPPSSSSSEDGGSEEELEELDFADMGRLRDRLDAAQTLTAARESTAASPPCKEVFTGMYNNRIHHNGTPLPQHAEATPEKHDTDTVINEMTVTSVTALENSTATLAIAEEHEIVVGEQEDIPVSSSLEAPISNEITTSHAGSTEEQAPAFFIDTEPTRPSTHRSASDVLFDRTWDGAPLGEDDEIIVYVAPHPRSRRASPIADVPRVRLPSRSLLTGTTTPAQNLTVPIAHEDKSIPFQPSRPPEFPSASFHFTSPSNAHEDKSIPPQPIQPPEFPSVSFHFTSPSKKQPRHRPVFTPGDRSKAKVQARKREARAARKRAQRQTTFALFGAMLSESQLRDADERERRDVRWESRRQDDSDVNWGDDDDDDVPENDGVDEVSNGLGGMDLDPDLEPDLEAMKGFVKSMSAEGSRHVTMDDIEDQERMRLEDEEEEEDYDSNDSHDGSDSSDEEDEEEKAVFEAEEEILVAESQGERPRGLSPSESSDEEEDSSDDELSPRGNFKARLRRAREKSRTTRPATEAPEDEDSSDAPFPPWNRANSDDDYIAHIEDLLEKHSGITGGKDRKQQKQKFRAIHNGQFDDYDEYVELNGSFSYADMQPAKRKKNKIKGLPADLQAAWEKVRVKKAERKRAREEARLLAALDPLTPKKGGKKGRKAMRAAANLDPTMLAQFPSAIVDMVSLEKQIRRFIGNVGGKNNMVLPPMDKESRTQVHDLANAFNLKSQSKGKGNGRYITLIKTTWTGTVNERKVSNIVKRRNGGFDRPYDGKSRVTIPKHKEGDEVGKAAPKIGGTNIGFKMLASMGWAEGDMIGGDASTGIHAPLTAIIKNTKLGLGATR